MKGKRGKVERILKVLLIKKDLKERDRDLNENCIFSKMKREQGHNVTMVISYHYISNLEQ